MSTPYILSFQNLKEQCDELEKSCMTINGNCKDCKQRRACRMDIKERNIGAARCMGYDETRFPNLLKFAQLHPVLLYGVPPFIYERAYGTYHDSLPCPFQSETIIRHINELSKVYELLWDAESKQTLLNVVMYRLTFNREYIFRTYCSEPQYFISSFRSLGSNEVYVDCGAFTGDTFEEYCVYNTLPKAAYLFEPDSANINKLRRNINQYTKQTQIHVIEKGIYKVATQLYFVGGKQSESYLSEKNEKNSIPLSVTSIDESIDEEISFVKMDIEGSEMNAILGAKKHIQSNYPKLAICVYHKPEDLWELPLTIHELFPKYTKFELRHHSKDFNETVLYVSR